MLPLTQMQIRPPVQSLLHYAATLSVAALAVVLFCFGAIVFGLLSLLTALISLLSTRDLMHRIAKADEQKCNLDQQLIQSQKLASIGELSSGIAHEINNPLAIIGQETEWIQHLLKADITEHPKKMEDLNDSMQEIVRQVERCRDITHKLLDFARKKEPLIQAVDINKLIDDMARLVEREAIQKNIEIVRDYLKDLPQVRTDPPLLRQVVLNLLNNAAYAIGQDGTITIRTFKPDSDTVDIVVTDTGCGIPEEHLSKIFDPFFTTKPPGKGTGLGLSICHGIIVRLGGRILVASEVGKGTNFTIRLPIQSGKGAH